MTTLNFLSRLWSPREDRQSNEVRVTSYGASDEHPMSTRSASDGIRWKQSGKQHTSLWRYAAVLCMLLTIGVGNVWGDETTYTFSSKSWGASPEDWTNGKAGNALTSGRGIQVTTGASGANGTSPISFTNVSQVVVTYSTNASAGAGSIAVQIGSNTAVSKDVTKTGGTTDRTLTYDFSPNQTGKVKVTVTCTTNSIYVKSVKITTAASCSSEITITKGDNPANGTFIIDNSGTVCIDDGNASTTVTATPSSHYHLATATSTGGGTIGPISNNTCTISNISANTTINVTFAEDPTYTVTWVAGSNPSFSTQTSYAGTALTDPGTPSAASYCPGGKVFVGWTATPIVGEGGAPADLFTSVSGKSIPIGGVTYYAVFATEGVGGDITDVINNSVTNSHLSSSNTSTWVSIWETSAMTSGAKYKIRSMGINGASNYALQWNANAYLFCSSAPNTGLKLKSITIKTLATKNIGLYGSTSAYSDKASATSLTTLSATTDGATYTLTSSQLASNYNCVGINGTASSTQVVSISITYSGGISYSNYATTCCTPLGSINGSVLLTFFIVPIRHDISHKRCIKDS